MRVKPTFHGRRVLTLESRRAPELALLIVNYGGQPMVAPALREVPLESNGAALAFAAALMRREYGMVVLMTGIGTRLLVRLAEAVHDRGTFLAALAATRIVSRGPKPTAALREVGITPWLMVPSPNTWREVLETLDAKASGVCAGGTRVAVQEYGAPSSQLAEGLAGRGADVTSVPIYRWALPLDVRPLRAAVRAIIDDSLDVLILTAGVQLVHLLRVAADMQLEFPMRQALDRVVVASIGPMTSDELRRQDLPVDMEATYPKMGFLVKEAAERCEELLHVKRHVA